MSNLNWGRIVSGSVIAATIAFVTDGMLHEGLLSSDWKLLLERLGASTTGHGSLGMIYFALFELGRGFVSIFLYANMRTQLGPGPKTAALAGLVSWLAFSVTGPAQFIPLGLYSHALWLKVAAFQLVTSIVATVAGAALYKDPMLGTPEGA